MSLMHSVESRARLRHRERRRRALVAAARHAVALLLLGLWFCLRCCAAGLRLRRPSCAWLQRPLTSVLLILLVVHARLSLVARRAGRRSRTTCIATALKIATMLLLDVRARRLADRGRVRRAQNCLRVRVMTQRLRIHRSHLRRGRRRRRRRGTARHARAGAKRVCRRPASPRCFRRAVTRSRRRAASAPRSATWARTTGAGTCTTPSRAPTGSATRTRSSSCARKRPPR